MVYLTAFNMPSDTPVLPALFIPQTVFASNNQAVLMGVLKKGDLLLNSTTSVSGKTYSLVDIQLLNAHPKLVKAGDKENKVLGIVLANMSPDDAQKIVNQELIFKK